MVDNRRAYGDQRDFDDRANKLKRGELTPTPGLLLDLFKTSRREFVSPMRKEQVQKMVSQLRRQYYPPAC